MDSKGFRLGGRKVCPLRRARTRRRATLVQPGKKEAKLGTYSSQHMGSRGEGQLYLKVTAVSARKLETPGGKSEAYFTRGSSCQSAGALG